MYYYAFGLHIKSEIELPGVLKIDKDIEADVKIIKGTFEANLINDTNYIIEDDAVTLWWTDIGIIKISNGEKIIVNSFDNDYNQIIPFLLGPVMSILLHQRGYLVLHGSAVKINKNAVAFLGYRGIGKSTTAINLYKEGHPIITDDIIAIKFNKKGKPYIYPGYHHVRLSEDVYNFFRDDTNIITPIRTIVGKIFCDTSDGFSTEPIKLKIIYLLEENDHVKLTDSNSQETVIHLIRHSTTNRIFRNNDQINNLNQCANIINNIKFLRLTIPHVYNDIPMLISLIIEKS